MPEEEVKTTNNAEEVKSTLLSVVDRIAGSRAGGSGDAPSTGGSGATAPIVIILLAVVVIGFSVLGVMLVMSRRKAAQLAADVRRLEEEKARVLEDQKLEENAKAREDAEVKVSILTVAIDNAGEKLKTLRAKNEERKKTISAISDWDDFVVVDKRSQ